MTPNDLSRRERQIMDIIYRLGQATAGEVMDHLEDPPSYSAVRALLRILEEKGHLAHSQDGPRYLYRPTLHPDLARRTALRHVVRTFFDDSAARAVAALLDEAAADLSDSELDRLAVLIDQARREGH
ncbi:MAG TPA: BlaI/MecI/CopY family transcriptional regulator [Rubricoccaceae bacterium]|nr:BlaI/MecI/CopY family transcriptional regulator [Rubricoccaceae bacterium]